MNKKIISLTLLSASMLLASCGGNAPTSSSQPSIAPSSEQSQDITVDPSSEPTSTPTSEEKSSESEVQGPLTIGSYTDEGVTYALPGISYSAGVYTFTVSLTEKTAVSLSGELAGSINIVTPDDTVKGKSITIELNGCTISATGETAPINYMVSSSNVGVKAKKGTINTLTYAGAKKKLGCIQSENNIEIGGKGTLVLNGTADTHGMKGDDITLKSATKLEINCGKNAFNGKDFVDDGYTGTMALAVSGSMFAFDDSDPGQNGSILFPACTVTGTCANVFKADAGFSIPEGASITASATGVLCENTGDADITITNNGSFILNGETVAASVVVSPKA